MTHNNVVTISLSRMTRRIDAQAQRLVMQSSLNNNDLPIRVETFISSKYIL
jgi:hypothetical protein